MAHTKLPSDLATLTLTFNDDSSLYTWMQRHCTVYRFCDHHLFLLLQNQLFTCIWTSHHQTL